MFLEPPVHIRPVKLERLAATLGTPGREDFRAQQKLEGQRQILRRLLRQSGQQNMLVPRELRRALLAELRETGNRELRSQMVRAASSSPAFTWRWLWDVWTLADVERGLVIPSLAAMLSKRLQSHNPRMRQRLPAWLSQSSLKMHRALHDPIPAVVSHCEKEGVHVSLFGEVTGLDPGSGLGLQALKALFKGDHAAWWSMHGVDELRTWAVNRPRDLVRCVVERQLVEFGRGVSKKSELARAGRPKLKEWVLKILGDPARNRGNWSDVSERARTIFEMILADDEFFRLLAEFRKHAEDARADFWARYVDALDDALYVRTSQSAVCLMKFGRTLVIEFGSTGNACYFYAAGALATPLRITNLRDYRHAAQFKGMSGLTVAQQRLAYDDKFSHNHHWQARFDTELAQRTILPSTTTAPGRHSTGRAMRS